MGAVGEAPLPPQCFFCLGVLAQGAQAEGAAAFLSLELRGLSGVVAGWGVVGGRMGAAPQWGDSSACGCCWEEHRRWFLPALRILRARLCLQLPKELKKRSSLSSVSGERQVAKRCFEILQRGRCWLGEAFGVQEDQPSSRGRMEKPVTRRFGEEAGQKSARAGRRLSVSGSGTYLSEKWCFKCLGWLDLLWPGLLGFVSSTLDSPLSGQGWKRAGSIFLSEYQGKAVKYPTGREKRSS